MGVIVCPSCKWEQVGGEECQRCGIIFDRYRPPEERPIFQQEVEEEVEEEEIVPSSRLRRAFRILRIVSPALIVLCICLIFSLPTPPKVDRSAEATERAQQKLAGVQQAIQNGGPPYNLHFSETELNSILALALRPPDPASSPGTAAEQEAAESIRDLRIKLKGDLIHVYVAFRFHGKMLTLSLTGKIRVADQQLRLDADSGRFGSLPLPSPVLERAMRKVFDSPENREKFRLPDYIQDVRIEDGSVVLVVNPRSSAKSAVQW